MIDALLFAVRDHLRAAGFGYGPEQVDIRDDGKPPENCGSIYIAVHPGAVTNSATRNLDERFAWNLTLTMRVSVPANRVGDQLLASKLSRKSGPGNPSFTSRVEQLRGWGHMNWKVTVLVGQTPASANDNILSWSPSGTTVYGFCEPASKGIAERPILVGPDWLGADPDSGMMAIKSEIRFDGNGGARRLQPQTLAVGPFV